MKRDLLEFFEDRDGGLSMSRLLKFLAWLPATGVMLHIRSVEALGVYLTAFVLDSAASKGLDAWERKRSTNARRR